MVLIYSAALEIGVIMQFPSVELDVVEEITGTSPDRNKSLFLATIKF